MHFMSKFELFYIISFGCNMKVIVQLIVCFHCNNNAFILINALSQIKHPSHIFMGKWWPDDLTSKLVLEHKQFLYEPRHEKTSLRGLRPGKTQTGLLNYRN